MKDLYLKEYENIKKLHRSGAGGIRVAIALTKLHDDLLISLFESVPTDISGLTIIALGGFGRKELCFKSDIDVMFLVDDNEQKEYVFSVVQKLLHKLLDIGLDVGHSVRSIQDCINIGQDDFESQMSLLESRYICGSKSLFNELKSSTHFKIQNSDKRSFVQNVYERTIARHRKYGNTSKLLEPNIKNSSGGLRDIHTALWLMYGTDLVRPFTTFGKNETATLAFLKCFKIKKQFTTQFIKDMRIAFDFLLQSRNEMHIQSKTMHDVLEFNIQPGIASSLGYQSRKKRRIVELFMQDYYRSSRSAEKLCSRIMDFARNKWLELDNENKTLKLFGEFVLHKKRIDLRKRSIRLTNELLLKAFLLRSERKMELSFRFEDSIHRQLHGFKPLSNKTETDLLRQLLHRPNSVGNSIQKMNDLGLLERWLPEWKAMVSFFQHNQYHFYTADEHTVIMLNKAEALEESNSNFGLVFRKLPRRDTLYLACLFHDIAKPIHIGKHEIKGVPIAKRALNRLNYDDVAADVSFLVRHHLLMEQIAFRRDLNDQHTIIEFTKVFGRVELLDYLFVLTYADLSAVNRNVLSDWKERMLWDLYSKARIILLEEITAQQVHSKSLQESEQKKNEILVELLGTHSKESIEEHIKLSDSSYFVAFSVNEISSHITAIQQMEDVTASFQHYDKFSEVTFIAKDSKGLLSKLCGVLSANDVNILDAQIFTRSDGIVVDKFRVSQFTSHTELSVDVCEKIKQDVEEVLGRRIDVAHLIERHRMRWKRRIKPFNPNTRCDVVFENHPKYTIIDIYAPDTLGFLYRITEAISKLDLNIAFAKIATRVDGIVDSFYITNNNGGKIEEAQEQEFIAKNLIETIKLTMESKLVVK